MERKKIRLGEILIEQGLIIPIQLENALAEQKKTNQILGEILVEKKIITEKQLMQALSNQFNITCISMEYKYIDWDFVKQFSSSLILDYDAFPIEKDEWTVTIAITNPLDSTVLTKAEAEAKGSRLKVVLVTLSEMNEAKSRYKEYVRSEYFK